MLSLRLSVQNFHPSASGWLQIITAAAAASAAGSVATQYRIRAPCRGRGRIRRRRGSLSATCTNPFITDFVRDAATAGVVSVHKTYSLRVLLDRYHVDACRLRYGSQALHTYIVQSRLPRQFNRRVVRQRHAWQMVNDRVKEANVYNSLSYPSAVYYRQQILPGRVKGVNTRKLPPVVHAFTILTCVHRRSAATTRTIVRFFYKSVNHSGPSKCV